MNHTTRIVAAITAYAGPMPLAAIRSAVPDVSRATVDQVVSLLTAEPPYRVETAGVEPEIASGAAFAPDLLSRAAA